MKILLVSIFTLPLSGCAILTDQVEWASDKAADAVESYCENLTQDQRLAFGDRVRTKTSPHSVNVTCDTDQSE